VGERKKKRGEEVLKRKRKKDLPVDLFMLWRGFKMSMRAFMPKMVKLGTREYHFHVIWQKLHWVKPCNTIHRPYRRRRGA
jgi:hypothetical protein